MNSWKFYSKIYDIIANKFICRARAIKEKNLNCDSHFVIVWESDVFPINYFKFEYWNCILSKKVSIHGMKYTQKT
jgi:hypothetical protein